MSCMVGFQNHMARCSVVRKDHVTSLKAKATIQTSAMRIGYNENVFVSYSYPRVDC